MYTISLFKQLWLVKINKLRKNSQKDNIFGKGQVWQGTNQNQFE